VIKAAVAKIAEVKHEVLPTPQSRLTVNESKAKGLNRDIDNLLDETIPHPAESN
jgi:hypothetical protein